MPKILTFTDFSKCAQTASDAAIDMAAELGWEAHFVHYKNNMPDNWESGTLAYRKAHADHYREYVHTSIQLAELESKAEERGAKVSSQLVYNFSTKNVETLIGENQIDYIILGSHGRTHFEELMMGSYAQEVVRYSPVPVMVVKDALNVLNAHLVFTSDFSTEAERVFGRLTEFAQWIGAPVSLLHVRTPKSKNQKDEIEARMSGLGSNTVILDHKIIEAKTVEAGIEKYCRSVDHAVIAMGTHGYKGLSRVMKGSRTEKVINRLRYPVLSLPIMEG